MNGAILWEDVKSDFKCTDGIQSDIVIGQCNIDPGNSLDCVDRYGLCLPPSSYKLGTCVETYTQYIYVDKCLVETRAIVFTVTKTPESCSGTAVRR